MRHFLTIALCHGIISALASSAWAQFGFQKLNLYSDQLHTSTQVYDQVPGLITVYVFQEDQQSDGYSTAASFTVVSSEEFTGVWLSDTSPFLTLGTSPTGISLSYGGCRPLPIQALEIRYITFGTSSDCSYLEVVKPSDWDFPVTLPCEGFGWNVATGGRLTVNPAPNCTPLPIAPTTWGRIKAMYQ